MRIKWVILSSNIKITPKLSYDILNFRTLWNPEKAGPMKSKIPLDRFAEVDEVVRPVMFLLSKESSMVNASNMYIDGGFVNTN